MHSQLDILSQIRHISRQMLKRKVGRSHPIVEGLKRDWVFPNNYVPAGPILHWNRLRRFSPCQSPFVAVGAATISTETQQSKATVARIFLSLSTEGDETPTARAMQRESSEEDGSTTDSTELLQIEPTATGTVARLTLSYKGR